MKLLPNKKILPLLRSVTGLYMGHSPNHFNNWDTSHLIIPKCSSPDITDDVDLSLWDTSRITNLSGFGKDIVNDVKYSQSFRNELHPVPLEIPGLIDCLHEAVSEEEVKRGYFSTSLVDAILEVVSARISLEKAYKLEKWKRDFHIIDDSEFEYIYGLISKELESSEFERTSLSAYSQNPGYYSGTMTENFKYAILFFKE